MYFLSILAVMATTAFAIPGAIPRKETTPSPPEFPSLNYHKIDSSQFGNIPRAEVLGSGHASSVNLNSSSCTTTYTSVCTETSTLIYRSTTAYTCTTITHIFATALPAGSCTGSPTATSPALGTSGLGLGALTSQLSGLGRLTSELATLLPTAV